MTSSSTDGDALEGGSEPRQIDIIRDVTSIPVLDSSGNTINYSAPLGVALVTQCCDVQRGGKGMAHLSPICNLDDADASAARSGRSPRYISIPDSADEFIDLGVIGSADQGLLALRERKPGVPTEVERHELRQRIGRRFARFPFPDELVPMLGVLQQKVREKAGRPNSKLGQVLRMLVSIRVEMAPNVGAQPPWDVRLLFIAERGTLPTESFGEVIEKTELSVDEAADRVLRADLASDEIATAWNLLVAVLIREMSSKRPSIDVLGSFDIEVVDEDDLSFGRYRYTVGLDLDDLSPAEGDA